MTKFGKCSQCKKYDFLDRHTCSPRYLVMTIDDEEVVRDFISDGHDYETQIIYADSAKEAAIQACRDDPEWYEVDEVNLLCILEADIEEGDNHNTVWPQDKYELFTVAYETVPEFYVK